MTSDPINAAAEWVHSYFDSVADLPVLSRVSPGDVEKMLPPEAPEDPEAMTDILEDLDAIIIPGISHWNHPRFFGYFANSAPPPAIAGELIAAAVNANGMLWRTSPAATEVELVVCRWVASFLGLPPWFGYLNDTASTSTMHALAAARHEKAPESRSKGLAGAPQLTIYCSDQAHSSVDKAVLTLGIGTDNLRKVPTDSAFRMDAVALDKMVREDIVRGKLPCAVVPTVGTTAVTAVDPLAEIAEVCRTNEMWMHVDAAYAGPASALQEFRWIFDGVVGADSLVVNPHKWLFVPMDASILFLREPDKMRSAFSYVPDYLATPDETVNLMDYGVALGRRFRALKIWMMFRALGAATIRQMIAEHIRLARLLSTWVDQSERFDLAAPTVFSVVNFHSQARDEEALVDRVNATGKAFVTIAGIGGRPAIHAAIGNYMTSEEDVAALWDLLNRV